MKYLLLVFALIVSIGSPSDGLTRMKHLSSGSAIKLSSVALSPTSVVGGNSSQGTVTLTKKAPSGGIVVTLSSSQPSVASVPASVTVASGQTTGVFTVTTSAVSVTTVASISASYGGVTKTANLTLTAVDTTPPVISIVAASNITTSGATITWNTNEASDTQVDYGTTTTYGSSTTLDSTLVTSHSATLSGLSTGTLYHYRVKSRDAAGNLATSGDFTFTTSSATGGVYYVATTGSDSNPGTQSQPFRTLTKGVSVLIAGDTLFMRAGTYVGLASRSGSATIPAGTSWTNPVTVKNYPGESVTITSGGEFCLAIENTSYVVIDGFILDGTGAFNCAKIRFLAHHIRMQNCEAKNSTNTGILLPDESPSNTVQGFNEFINNIVHDNGTRARFDHGIYLSVPNNLVERNEFYNNAAFGIQMDQGTSESNTIRYNRVHDNARISTGDDGGGIVCADGANNQIYYNLVYNNGAGDGIFVAYGAVDAKVFNNVCVGNGYFYTGTRGECRNNIFTNGLRVELTTGLTVTNNLTNNAILQVGTNSGLTLANNQIGDPVFVNAGANDYHLQSGSPCINSGISVGLISDFDSHSVANPPDIGAYEF